jgi:phosphoribosylformylglycinamidine synthase
LPGLDLQAVSATAGLVRGLVTDGVVQGVHDVAAGGLGGALGELAVRSGIGVTVARVPDHVYLFSESVGRALICVEADHVADIERRAAGAGVTATRLGVAGGDRIRVKGVLDVGLDDAVSAWRERLPDVLGGIVDAG